LCFFQSAGIFLFQRFDQNHSLRLQWLIQLVAASNSVCVPSLCGYQACVSLFFDDLTACAPHVTLSRFSEGHSPLYCLCNPPVNQRLQNFSCHSHQCAAASVSFFTTSSCEKGVALPFSFDFFSPLLVTPFCLQFPFFLFLFERDSARAVISPVVCSVYSPPHPSFFHFFYASAFGVQPPSCVFPCI